MFGTFLAPSWVRFHVWNYDCEWISSKMQSYTISRFQEGQHWPISMIPRLPQNENPLTFKKKSAVGGPSWTLYTQSAKLHRFDRSGRLEKVICYGRWGRLENHSFQFVRESNLPNHREAAICAQQPICLRDYFGWGANLC